MKIIQAALASFLLLASTAPGFQIYRDIADDRRHHAQHDEVRF